MTLNTGTKVRWVEAGTGMLDMYGYGTILEINPDTAKVQWDNGQTGYATRNNITETDNT